jgi:hypothetical protein
MAAANSFGGTLQKVGGALGNARAALNAQLVKMGQPAIDFAKAQASLTDQLNQATAASLAKSGMTAAGMMASMGQGGSGAGGLGSGSGSGLGSAAGKAGLDSNSFAKSKGGAGGAGAVDMSASGKGLNFNLKDDAKPGLQTGADVATSASAQYELGKGDISTNSGATIFNIISERYFKTGYPRLLEVDPVVAPAPAAAPVKK